MLKPIYNRYIDPALSGNLNSLIFHLLLQGESRNDLQKVRPTVCVTGAGAGVENAWEQKELAARKMFANGDESPASSARGVRRHSGNPINVRRIQMFNHPHLFPAQNPDNTVVNNIRYHHLGSTLCIERLNHRGSTGRIHKLNDDCINVLVIACDTVVAW